MGPSTGPRPASSMPMIQGSACQAASWTMIRPVAGPEVPDAESTQLVAADRLCSLKPRLAVGAAFELAWGGSDTGMQRLIVPAFATSNLMCVEITGALPRPMH